MGRDKLKRNLCFKPFYKEFVPTANEDPNTIILLHEEIEALYLMDNLGLYQADAAKKMGVSRPTFARIIKSAREKVSMALVSGAKIIIEDEKKEIKVCVVSSTKEKVEVAKPKGEFLFLYTLSKEKITFEVMDNPAFSEEKPAKILPLFLQQHHINFFVALEVGEGLRNALLAKGIFAKEQTNFTFNEFMQN